MPEEPSTDDEQISEEGGEIEDSSEEEITTVTDSAEDQDEEDVEDSTTATADVMADPMEGPEELTVAFKDFDAPFTYNGADHKPEAANLVVKFGEGELADDDYSIAYARASEGSDEYTSTNDFTSAGKIKVTVTGTKEEDVSKDKTGSIEYEITALDISKEGYEITGLQESYEASDSLAQPTVSVVKTGETSASLTAGTDYTVAFTKNGEAVEDFTKLAAGDTVTVTVTGKGNYSGTLTATFGITAPKKSLTDETVKVTLKGEGVSGEGTDEKPYIVEWKGGKAEPEVEVKDGDKTLVKGTDYTVEYTNNEAESENATVTVTGTGDDYNGEVVITFTIKDVRVALTSSNCEITVDPEADLTYTGKAIEPAVTVTYKYKEEVDGTETDKEKELTADDYTVAYANNTDVGTATVTITGKGDYKGDVSTTFVITKAASLIADPVTIYADVEQDKNGGYDLSAIEFKTADGKAVTASATTYAIAQKDGANEVELGDVLDAEPTISGSKLSYALKSITDPNTVTKDATVVIAATFANYADSNVTLTVKAVAKEKLFFSAAADTQTYTSKAIAYAGKITQVVGGTGENKDDEVTENNKLDEVKGNFTYSYGGTDPINAGEYTVTISLTNHATYKAEPFNADLTITKAPLTITAKNKNWIVGSEKPATTATPADYTVTGLLGEDTLTTAPTTLAYYHMDESGAKGAAVADAEWADLTVGTQLIIEVTGAVASGNYELTTASGVLTVKPDKTTPITTYDVTLHNVNHTGGTASIAVQAGQLIREADARAKIAQNVDGYEFMNWYKDEACTKLWNFATETVQSDMDLYAVWANVVNKDATEGTILQIRDIPVQSYTGNKIQPNVQVYDADGNELKKGKDYTIAYKNNINADAVVENGDTHTGGYMGRDGQEGDGKFNENLPHVIITGKGNYAGTKAAPNVIYKNFSIAKANIGEGDSLAAGFTMKYTNQFVAGSKDLKPFTSLKYKKAMTLGKDYSVTIEGEVGKAFAGKDEDGNAVALTEKYVAKNGGKNDKTAPVITKGYFGDFTLVVTGLEGNYTGEVRVPVVVAADGSKLLKNAKINLGKNIKSVNFSSDYFDELEEAIILPVANVVDGKYYKVDGSTVADEESNVKDVFTVSMGKGKNLTYLDATEDYEISYSNNDAVGKATLTITAAEGSGYVGSVSTTFTIKGIAFKNGKKGTVKVSGLEASYPYTGSPITKNDEITVATVAGSTEGEGEEAVFTPDKTFVFGQEYTVKYANNLKKGKATVTFTANPKSGYTGSFKETFQIGDLSLMDKEVVQVRNTDAQNSPVVEQIKAENNKSAAITWTTAAPYAVAGSEIGYSLWDAQNNRSLVVGTDYTAKYSNNKAVTTATTKPNKMPTLTITGKGNYSGKIVITFTIVNSNTSSLVPSAAATQLNANKTDTYEYKPAITVKNGAKTVNKKEYTVDYDKNTQAEVKAYLTALEEGTSTEGLAPTAKITIKNTSSFYTAQPENGTLSTEEWDAQENTRTIQLPIYKEKLTSKNCTINLTANPSEYRYTGVKVTPTVVSVIFGGKALTTGSDVTVDYGTNVASGKNKGTVTVTGQGIYGGSVTKKFNINTSYIYKPNPNSVTKTALTAENTRVTLKLDGKELGKEEDKYFAYVNSDGSAIEPAVKVEYKEVAGKKTTYTELFENDTYSVAYGENKAVGEGTVTITILSTSEQYTGGPIEVKFDIKEAPVVDNKDLSKCEVTLYQPGTTGGADADKLAKYTGDVEGVDYAITVASIPESGLEPVVVVKNGETALEDKVYTVAYTNNTAASTNTSVATVTITPATGSEFTGTKEVKFWITVGETPAKTDLSGYAVVVKKTSDSSEISKSGDSYPVEVTTLPEASSTDPLEGVTLEVKAASTDATALTESKDYTVTWSYVTDSDSGKTTGTATITGTGDYTGSFTVTFDITVSSEA